MTSSLHRTPTRPVLVVVGTWDPFGADLEQALKDLSAYAERRSLDLAAVMFDPAPATFLSEEPWYPFYNDRYARVEMLFASGVASVMTMDFEAEDIEGTAHTFFDLVRADYEVAEVFLGPGQSLGRGPRGSRRTIARLGREHGFRVTTWNRESDSGRDVTARHTLHRGAVAEAAELLGRPPVLSVAGAAHRAENRIPWTWPCGTYHAVEIDGPMSDPATSFGRAVRFELRGEDECKRAVWSRDIGDGYVAVLRGPGDDARARIRPVARPRVLAA